MHQLNFSSQPDREFVVQFEAKSLTTPRNFIPVDKQYVSAGSELSLADNTKAWNIALLDGVRAEWDPPKAPSFQMVDPRTKDVVDKSPKGSLPNTWTLFMLGGDPAKPTEKEKQHRLGLYRPDGVFGRLDLIAVDSHIITDRMKPTRADLGWDTFHLNNGTFTYSVHDGAENVLTMRHWVVYQPKNVTGQLNLALWDGVTVHPGLEYVIVALRAVSVTLPPVDKDDYAYSDTA
jgi:hypothetical protein